MYSNRCLPLTLGTPRNIAEIQRVGESPSGVYVKKILYVDMDNVLVDFKSAFPRLSAEIKTEYEDRMDDIPGIFALMEPMPGALEAYRELAVHFDTYILSTSPWNNPSASNDKLQWVKKYLGDVAHKRLILTHHKNLNVGQFLVDDRTNNGAGRFEGEHLLFGSERFPDWTAVKAYLLQKV